MKYSMNSMYIELFLISLDYYEKSRNTFNLLELKFTFTLICLDLNYVTIQKKHHLQTQYSTEVMFHV